MQADSIEKETTGRRAASRHTDRQAHRQTGRHTNGKGHTEGRKEIII
jgi:hypothetical protein